MQYIQTTGWEDGLAHLTQRLAEELRAGHRVLWILSGGSNISGSVTVMDSISGELSRGLTILLGDERYGVVGHTDSNEHQLKSSGFDRKQARLLKILQPDLSYEQTVRRYRDLVDQEFDQADIIIAQLGIGADGHLAGILPQSSAARQSSALVAGYQSSPFQRLTLTFPALLRVTAAYVFAFGAAKHDALSDLKNKQLKPAQQPAQILKQLPEAYVYNDQIET